MPEYITTGLDQYLQFLAQIKSAESRFNEVLPLFNNAISDKKLKNTVQQFITDSSKRLDNFKRMESISGLPIETIAHGGFYGLCQEVETVIKKRSKDANIDLLLISQLQKLISYIITDYSYAGNLAYQYKISLSAVRIISDSFSQIQDFNKELSLIAVKMIKDISKIVSSQNLKQELQIDRLKKQITELNGQVQRLLASQSKTSTSEFMEKEKVVRNRFHLSNLI